MSKEIYVNGIKYVREDMIGEYFTKLNHEKQYKNNLHSELNINDWIKSFIDNNKDKFEKREGCEVTKSYLLIHEKLLENNLGNISLRIFLKHLKANGFLVLNSQKKYKHLTTIKGLKANYYKILWEV